MKTPSGIKDLTPAQADRWIDQEFAKVNAGNAAARIASERETLRTGKMYGFADDLPNSMKAHERLIARIEEAF